MEGILTTALQEIAKQGLLAILLLGAIWAWKKRDEELMKVLAARIEDSRELSKIIVEAVSVMKAVTAGQEKAAAASSAQAETTRVAMQLIERVLDRLERGK